MKIWSNRTCGAGWKEIKPTRDMRERIDPSFSEFLLRIAKWEDPSIRDDLILLSNNWLMKIRAVELVRMP